MMATRVAATLACLLAACWCGAVEVVPAPGPASSPTVVLRNLTGNPALSLAIAVGSGSSFRLSVRSAGSGSAALPSPSLDGGRTIAPSQTVTYGAMHGLATMFGALVADEAGNWVLYDADNNTVVSSDGPPTHTPGKVGAVSMNVKGSTMQSAQPCLSNGGFGPPYLWDSDAGVLAFAVSPWDYDGAEPIQKLVHCYPAAFVGSSGAFDEAQDWLQRTLKTGTTGRPPVRDDTCAAGVRHASTDGIDVTRSKNHPGGLSNTTVDTCCQACNADSDCSGWIFADLQHPDPSGHNCWLVSHVKGLEQRTGRTYGGASPPPPPPPPPPPAGRSGWWIGGADADWYLAPAKHGYNFTAAYFDLTGSPSVPPRSGMAFMATYWGYQTMYDVVSNMSAFRSGNYPIDSFIMDYDWFGPKPCGPAGAQGGLNCGDFGYKPDFFGNLTFQVDGQTVATHGPKELLAFVMKYYNMRWGGIRKPRSYSNIQLSNSSGWLLPDEDNVGAGNNNWNYSVPALQEWYSKNHLHFLEDGVNFWWNDEGETQWFTYLWWNMAQQAEWQAAKPNMRHFTINRAFQPGMQRFPAVTWSGDGQDCSHGKMLEFVMYGQPYTCCDMTSPDATVLVRQYQNAVFSPIMRVHQMHGVPRFPFHWCGAQGAGGGSPAHCTAFRKALEMRYHLLPYFYSLAHGMRTTGRPISHPASFEYEEYADGGKSYMVGSEFVLGDVSTSRGPDPAENTTTTYLPPGDWFSFNSTSTVVGNQTLVAHQVALDMFPVYVRPGSVIPLQRDVIQYSDAVGGVLEVQVYAGVDGAFAMVEDDGETYDYKKGVVRTTAWAYNDATQTLTWTQAGSLPASPHDYTSVVAVLFVQGAAAPKVSKEQKLTQSGTITW